MHVLSILPDHRIGGPHVRSLKVADQLVSEGVRTSFIVPAGRDEFLTQAIDHGHECFEIEFHRPRTPTMIKQNIEFLSSFLDDVRKIHKKISIESPDIVHVNGPLSFQAAMASHRSRAKLVWHFNDVLTPKPLHSISSYLARRWSDEIVVASDAVGQYFFDESVPTHTIYPPVDLIEFNPRTTSGISIQQELGLDTEAQVIGTVGNLNPVKGHDTLIKSIPDVLAKNGDVRVLIVGRTLESRLDYADQVRGLVDRLGLEGSVKFLGWREDIPALLDAFDVFVLPSVSEACPTVVLEAMAMETPVVATDVGGVSEQIPDEDHGWVVPPEDPAALATGLTDALCSAPERARRATNARERVEKIFSLDVCVERHERAYKKAARGS